MNYYNENDPKAAAWLRELIECGEIPDGRIDVRSICDVTANDLAGFVQCHFFAGIGGWSYALRLAGWPEDKPVWTGSCPCQPFSAAGKGKGELDERHLWPAFFNLIQKCHPELVFGEQVASAIGHGWLDGIQNDLEKEGYTCGAAVLAASSLGAPHIRQRLYWVADAKCHAGEPGRTPIESRESNGEKGERPPIESGRCGNIGRLADSQQPGLEGHAGHEPDGSKSRWQRADTIGSTSESGGIGEGMGDPARGGCGISGDASQPGSGRHVIGAEWAGSKLIPCRDGKFRRAPVEPSLFPLANGVPGRVGLLRGAGNAITPQVAAEFIQAFLEVR